MHKEDKPSQDEMSKAQHTDTEHIYAYAFCITFRNNVNFTAFVQFVIQSFTELHIRHTPLATKGAVVAVEFLAQGNEPLLRTLREELIRRHGSE